MKMGRCFTTSKAVISVDFEGTSSFESFLKMHFLSVLGLCCLEILLSDCFRWNFWYCKTIICLLPKGSLKKCQ